MTHVEVALLVVTILATGLCGFLYFECRKMRKVFVKFLEDNIRNLATAMNTLAGTNNGLASTVMSHEVALGTAVQRAIDRTIVVTRPARENEIRTGRQL